eukprot:1123005-Prymnesium_polylepis.1
MSDVSDASQRRSSGRKGRKSKRYKASSECGTDGNARARRRSERNSSFTLEDMERAEHEAAISRISTAKAPKPSSRVSETLHAARKSVRTSRTSFREVSCAANTRQIDVANTHSAIFVCCS